MATPSNTPPKAATANTATVPAVANTATKPASAPATAVATAVANLLALGVTVKVGPNASNLAASKVVTSFFVGGHVVAQYSAAISVNVVVCAGCHLQVGPGTAYLVPPTGCGLHPAQQSANVFIALCMALGAMPATQMGNGYGTQTGAHWRFTLPVPALLGALAAAGLTVPALHPAQAGHARTRTGAGCIAPIPLPPTK